jgi:hypothetical protein
LRTRALNDLRLARLRLRKPVRENLPAMLIEMMRACLQIVEERERFPELGSGKHQARALFTSPNRERDLRRLEACALVLMSIVSHLDLVTLRSGRRRRDGSCDAVHTHAPRRRPGRPDPGRQPRWSSLELETGLHWQRTTRAIADLVAAKYLTAHQPRRGYDVDGERRWRGFPVVYQVTPLLVERLGIDRDWLADERKKAQHRQEHGPAPLVDVRLVRARARVIRAQARAARRAQLVTRHDPALVAFQKAQLERLGRKRE